MLLLGQDELVASWVTERTQGILRPTGIAAFGWVENSRIVAGIVAYSYYPQRNLFADFAIDGRRFPPALLRFALRYAFYQLALPRLTFAIDSANVNACRLAERLGSVREATLSGAGGIADLVFYCLRPDSSSVVRRFSNGPQTKNTPTA